MDIAPSSSPAVKKSEEDDKRDVKPIVKTLNRVPRACNACRKQKMRCEGAENPPCRRCRNTGLDCLFEKPSREASLTGEAGLERMRALEAQVNEIRETQKSLCANVQEILNFVRAAGHPSRSPSVFPPPTYHSPQNMSSPSMSTPTANHQHLNEIHHPSPPGGPNGPPPNPMAHPSSVRSLRPPMPNVYTTSGSPGDMPPHSQQPPTFNTYNQSHAPGPAQSFSQAPNRPPSSNTVLPPFSSFMPPPPQVGNNVSSMRFHSQDHKSVERYPHASGSKRPNVATSNVTSAESSDVEDDDDGGLPASGLVAPWEVLRGLADVAIQRAAKEGRENSCEPQSRTRTPSPDRSRPSKRRKIRHMAVPTFHDVVTKSILPEDDARELFKIFYDGCSTFLPVFDINIDTFESLHERSPFAVNAICMVGARVRDGGGKPSEAYVKLLDEVQNIARASLFAPVLRVEAIQAMILVSGWSDNGWLSGGHAVRMAMELSMHKAWPRLLRRIIQNKVDREHDRELVIASRIWFCLYLFEHQLSYGTGRPAVLRDDESVRDCRQLLRHPLAIDDDMRLVSTVELIKIREHIHEAMSPLEGPVKMEHFEELVNADKELDSWFRTWDNAFSQKWPNAAFYRQSLQIQQLHAQLFHYATALRGINGPADVHKMPAAQRDLAIKSITIALKGLDITVNSPSYREGMKYAVHYTHATATFAASFLLRLARLFPADCNMATIRDQVERLSSLMLDIPGKRYALTLQLMLKKSRKRKSGSTSRSPHGPRESSRSLSMVIDGDTSRSPGAMAMMAPPHQGRNGEPFSPTYNDMPFATNHNMIHQHVQSPMAPPHGHPQYPHRPSISTVASSGTPTDAEAIWQGFETTPQEQLPVWLSDQSLGGPQFSQNGMDAFLLPNEYLPNAPQIW